MTQLRLLCQESSAIKELPSEHKGLGAADESWHDLDSIALPTLIETLGQAACAKNGNVVIDEKTKAFLLEEVSQESMDSGFGQASLASSLDEIFSMCTAMGADADIFERIYARLRSSSKSRLKEKILDVSKRFRKYRESLSLVGIDRSMLVWQGIQEIPSYFSQDFFQDRPLTLEGLSLPRSWMYPFHRCLEIADSLAKSTKAPQVEILLPNVEHRPLLEQALSPLFQSMFSFHDSNFEESSQHEASGFEDPDFGLFVDSLFSIRKPAPLQPFQKESISERIFLTRPRSSLSESHQIASTIKDLIERGVPPHQISIVSQSAKRQQRIAAALMEHQIPRKSLLHPLFMQEHAPFASSLFRFLFDLYAWDSESEVVSQKTQWLLQSSLLKEHLTETIDLLKRLPNQASFYMHAHALLSVWNSIQQTNGVPVELQAAIEAMNLRAEVRNQIIKTNIHTLINTFSSLVQKKAIADHNISRSTFVFLCQNVLLHSGNALESESKSGVSIGNLKSLSSGSHQYLFFAGMIRGEFPNASAEDALLSDEERMFINQTMGTSLFTPRRFETQMLPVYFVNALSKSKISYLFCPQLNEDHRESIPSFYVTEVKHTAEHFGAVLKEVPQTKMEVSQKHSFTSHRINTEIFRESWFSSLGKHQTEKDPAMLRSVGNLQHQALPRFFSIGSAQKPLSSSALEDYARCPFRFFAKRILLLDQEEADTEDVDPLILGQWYHQVLQEFFTDRAQSQKLPLRADRDDFDALGKCIARCTEGSLVSHPALVEIRLDRLQKDIWRLIVEEAKHHKKGLTSLIPKRFEVPFLFGIDPPNSITHAPVYFHGKIDRIDESDQDVFVLDYKQGGIAFYDSVLRNQIGILSFQLPLYALAMRKDPVLQKESLSKRISATYYSIRDARISKMTLSETSFQEEFVHDQVFKMRAGDFSIAPKTCDGCGFESVCRIKKRR